MLSRAEPLTRSILLLDGPTDSRGIYVPMTRGRHHNDAYIVTSGEDTAIDIFATSIANNWIDRPAVARQAELDGTNLHRPGTLPAHELQALLGQQSQLTVTLTQLRTDLTELPGDHAWTVERRERAQADLAAPRGRMQDATDTLAQFDRPFRRRGHEAEIRNAHYTVETLPEKIRTQSAGVEKLIDQQHGIDKRLTRAETADKGRPAMETQLHDIADRLGGDRRNRSRGVRQPPGRIIDTLGRRPHEAKPGRSWDIAAGQLDQHQTAFGFSRGLGSTDSPKLPLGFLFSRGIAQRRSPSRGPSDQQRAAAHPRNRRPITRNRTMKRPSPTLGGGPDE